jgi:uncharacterized protein
MRKRHQILWSIAAIAVILVATAFWFEPQSLSVKTLEVETPAWPSNTVALRAVLISDVHVDGVHMPPARVAKIAQRVNALRPDVILLAGDYIGGDFAKTGPEYGVRSGRSAASNALQEDGLRALSGLSAPLGVYAVMGNHDCWWDCQRVREIFGQTHITLLENQSLQIRRAGGDVWLIGLEDGQTQTPDLIKATQDVPAAAARLVLEHNPGLFDWPSNRQKLMLAGHTHAGQIRLPLIGAPVRVSRHTEDTADGWTIEGDRTLIVTRGLGESGLPVRFGAAPQIMVLTIKPGTEATVREK